MHSRGEPFGENLTFTFRIGALESISQKAVKEKRSNLTCIPENKFRIFALVTVRKISILIGRA